MSAVPELGGDLSSRGSEISYLLLEISPSNEAAVPPARLFLGLVVDVSGSMGDDGVQLAAEACAELFGALKPLDQGFLVAFASEARRLTLPSLNYIGIRQALQSADVGGGTQLGQGVRVARDSMPAGSPGTMRHLILVTDGYTNDEALCKKVCSEAWSQGISVSSVGIGNCSAQLLKSIAERCSGSYYHVASLKDLANVGVADRRKVESVVLRNLEVDCLDLVQLHCPPTEVYFRPEVFGVLDDLVTAGKIRYYGVSVEKIEEALKAINYPGVQSVQIIFNMFRLRPIELFFPEAKRRQVGILARVPLASGLLTGKMTRQSTFASDDHRNYNRHGEQFDRGETFSGVDYDTGLEAVEEIRKLVPPGASMAQFALRWILMHDAVSCAIPGGKRPDQVEDNVRAAELPPLTGEQMAAVERIYNTYIREQVHQRW